MRIVQRAKRSIGRISATVKPVSFAQAYALIELMVASALLGLIVFSVYSAFSFGFATIKVTSEDIRADQILVQKLETLRIYDWSKINSSYIPTNFTATYSTGGSSTGVSYNGAIAISQAPVGQSYSNTLRQVTVSVSWVSAGVPRSRNMTTFVSQSGI